MKVIRLGLMFLLYPSFALSNQVIDVAVVFSSDSGISNSQKLVWAATTQLSLNAAFAPFNYSIEVHIVVPSVPISTASKHSQDVVEAMQSNTTTKLLRNTI